ncbi:polyprenyl synthetase family protein [Clostridiaceae bacterium M8S5]|nr:polyprenyl synthetase family protein [Clostridiaceae bacterium M8S5]
MNFNEELNKYQELINKELDKRLPNLQTLQKDIYQSMRYSIFAGGKRIRPILNLKACELVDGNIEDAMVFAVALEMIHTYSLIHDDLPAMDDDDYRRGRLTNHKVYGEAIAILAGDGLLNYAFESVLGYMLEHNKNDMKYLKAVNKIAKAAGVQGMIGGQIVDILSEGKDIKKEELEFIHKHKTSALIEASIISGAIVGGANIEDLEKLKIYSEALGLCFQIRDDILDKIGQQDKLGKDIGSDESNDKVTFVSLYGVEKSIEMTEMLCDQAKKSLEHFSNKEAVDFFKAMADFFVYREN